MTEQNCKHALQIDQLTLHIIRGVAQDCKKLQSSVQLFSFTPRAGEATDKAGDQAAQTWDATKQKATEAGHRAGNKSLLVIAMQYMRDASR